MTTYQKVAGRVWLWSSSVPSTPPVRRVVPPLPVRRRRPKTEAWWWTGPWSVLPGSFGLGIVAVPAAASEFRLEFVVPVAVAVGLAITAAGMLVLAELGNQWSGGDPGAAEILASVWAVTGLLFVLFSLRMFAEGAFWAAGACLALAAFQGLMAGRAAVGVRRLVRIEEARR